MMKGVFGEPPWCSAASVPMCSAMSRGCHRGIRKRQPAARSGHSARSLPNMGVFWAYGTPMLWWSPIESEVKPAWYAARVRSIMRFGPSVACVELIDTASRGRAE